ncbi:MAG: hypothetical protein M0C28_21175 [Candidatus Moduliflexus flocculans]|nr:hypothetical protein [Candidatus Moduliflexus flocculans]
MIETRPDHQDTRGRTTSSSSTSTARSAARTRPRSASTAWSRPSSSGAAATSCSTSPAWASSTASGWGRSWPATSRSRTWAASFKLCRISDKLLLIFKITLLDKVLDIHESCDRPWTSFDKGLIRGTADRGPLGRRPARTSSSQRHGDVRGREYRVGPGPVRLLLPHHRRLLHHQAGQGEPAHRRPAGLVALRRPGHGPAHRLRRGPQRPAPRPPAAADLPHGLDPVLHRQPARLLVRLRRPPDGPGPSRPVADSSTASSSCSGPRSAILQHEFPVFVIAFCFWADVFIAMSVTQFWIAVNDVFHPHQAKRLVGLFVMGGLLGGIAGSAVAALTTFAHIIRPENLLLVCAGPARPGPGDRQPRLFRPAEGRRGGRRHAHRPGLPGRLSGELPGRPQGRLPLPAGRPCWPRPSPPGRLINYQFKTVVISVFADADDRTAFIAVFFLIVLAVSTVFHRRYDRAASSRPTASAGPSRSRPAFLLLVSASVFVIPAGLMLAWVLASRGGDKVFDNTLSQSVRELLYVPVPEEVKYKAKIFIDMFVNKFATGFGAGLFLLLFYLRQLRLPDRRPPGPGPGDRPPGPGLPRRSGSS